MLPIPAAARVVVKVRPTSMGRKTARFSLSLVGLSLSSPPYCISCGVSTVGKLGEGRGGGGFSNSRRIREEEGVGFHVTWRVGPSSWRTSLPRSGIGQEGMTRNEWEKGKPSRLQLS